MRKALLVALAVMMCGYYAVAQDYPKAELFGGFNVTHLDTEGIQGKLGLPSTVSIKTWYPGWEIAGQYNLTKMFGIEGDFSGNYGKPVSVTGVTGLPSARAYTFLFGPVVSLRGEHMTPFVHALFGGNHASVDASAVSGPAGSETAFALAIGGGLDWKLTHHFAVRVGQFDYLYTNHCGNFGTLTANRCTLGLTGEGVPAHQNNFRFATGIVIH